MHIAYAPQEFYSCMQYAYSIRGGIEPGDDGVALSPIGPVGAGWCWELIRTRTAARLLNRAHLVVSGSCWWTLPDDADADSPLRSVNLKMSYLETGELNEYVPGWMSGRRTITAPVAS